MLLHKQEMLVTPTENVVPHGGEWFRIRPIAPAVLRVGNELVADVGETPFGIFLCHLRDVIDPHDRVVDRRAVKYCERIK